MKIVWIFVLSCIYIAITILVGYERNWWVSTLGFATGLLYRYKDSFWVKLFQNKYWKAGFMPICCLLIFIITLSSIELFLSLAYIFIPLVVVVLISYYVFPKNRLFIFLGNISYEVYLIHGAVLFLLRGNLIYIHPSYLYVFCVYLLTIILAYLFNLSIRKFSMKVL